MQILDTKKIAPLAFDFQSGFQNARPFSSTKLELRQRYLDKTNLECGNESKDGAPSATEQLFTEIKGMLADF